MGDSKLQSNGEPLKLNDIFWTLQGEGLHAGRRALFIRLPFCNLKCSWCDTSFNTFSNYDEQDFRWHATSEPAKFAVITGGEPTMNKQTPRIISILKQLDFEIAIETNGTFPVPEGIDFVTVSPKAEAQFKIHPKAFFVANEYKYVVDDAFDFAILDRHKDFAGRKSLSPEFNNLQANVNRILDYISKHPEWRLSLQTHKWIGIK